MELELQDYRNILVVLERASFNGMGEAEAGVILKQKVSAVVAQLMNPVEEEEDNGSDLSSDA